MRNYDDEKDRPKPFPFYPTEVTMREKVRVELINQLNMWDNNNPIIARRMAETFIELLQEQFGLLDEKISFTTEIGEFIITNDQQSKNQQDAELSTQAETNI